MAGQRPPAPDIDLYEGLEDGLDASGPDEPGTEVEPGSEAVVATGGRAGRVDYRSSTIDGHPVDPTEAVAQALLGHIRRVILDADSTDIE